jgi:hypothetical protein
VDSLDGAGRIVDQRLSWALGDIGGGSRVHVEVPVKRARVGVFSYDRIDEARLMFP